MSQGGTLAHGSVTEPATATVSATATVIASVIASVTGNATAVVVVAWAGGTGVAVAAIVDEVEVVVADVPVNMSAGVVGAHASCPVVVGAPASSVAVSVLENVAGSADMNATVTVTVTVTGVASTIASTTGGAAAAAGCGPEMGRGRLLGTMRGRRAMTFPGSLFPHRQAGVRRMDSKLRRSCACLNCDK